MFKTIANRKGFYVVTPFIGVIFILIVITMAAFVANESAQQLELSKAGFGDEMVFLGQVLVADASNVYLQNGIQRLLNDGLSDVNTIKTEAENAFEFQVENLYAKTFDADLFCTHSRLSTRKVIVLSPPFKIPLEYNPGVGGTGNRWFYYIYDGVGDECDSCPDDRFNDIDGDGYCDGDKFNPLLKDGAHDNCPYAYNPPIPPALSQADSDFDGRGDACDPSPDPDLDRIDKDNDDVINFLDNCAENANLDQADSDRDAIGDDCDPCPDDRYNDIDGDGLCENGDDNCPGSFEYDLSGDITHFNPAPQEDCPDTDPDKGNACDECLIDIDGDGIGDVPEDTDGDGITDYFDNCMNAANPDQQDVDDGDCFRELTIIPKDYKLHCTSLEAFGEFDIVFTGRKYLLVGTDTCCTDPEGICGLPDDSGLDCLPP